MKGIILAGGSGTRLYPITMGISKQLMPIYDKPMIYYPLSILMIARIKDILIITTIEDQPGFVRLLGNGENFGINIKYEIQKEPNGIAEAFIIGEKFIGNDSVCLILGDNLFYGQGIGKILRETVKSVENNKKSVIFGYEVSDPERYGVVEFDKDKKVISIEEKPKTPKSNFAVVGLYFYTNEVIQIAKNIRPSERGELEITSINQVYLNNKNLNIEILNRGFAWFDTGTHESMLNASNFIQIIELRQGLKIGCLEEIGYINGWLGKESLIKSASKLSKSSYGKYLNKIL